MRKKSFNNNIGKILFKKIFVWYILIASLLTIFQIYSEYNNRKINLEHSLETTANIFSKPLSNAIWFLDNEQIKANAESIVQLDAILGLTIYDTQNREVLSLTNEKVLLEDKISYPFKLKYGNTLLGSVLLITSTKMVLKNMKENIVLIVLNSMIKSFVLMVLFLYFTEEIISKELNIITELLNETTLEHDDVSSIPKVSKSHSHEIEMLIKSYAQMQKRLKEAKLEIVKSNQQLIEQSKFAQMGEMISMIAHQWRQPLTAISSTAIAMKLKAQRGKLDDESIYRMTDRISNYSQHLSSTINDFRNFFSPSKDKRDTTYAPIIKSVLNIIEVSLHNKNITIKKEFNSNTIFNTYPNEVKQVLLNLIKNAEDAVLGNGIENPTITIRTDANTLSVSDNGGGIPKEVLGDIFIPYFSTKLEKNGTGLGLYMSKVIIEEHCEGKICVSNSNEGAVFEVVLVEQNSSTKEKLES